MAPGRLSAALVWVALPVASTAFAQGRAVTVEVSQGALVGSADNGVRRFLAIPFAAPPTGALRFRSPQVPASWSGPRPATEFAPKCLQASVRGGTAEVTGDEDCLYLNVYRPDTDTAELPVLVWIHGGGRRVGDGRRDVTAFVRATGSLVAMVQYRLDHLAFLAHPALTREDPSRLASGNYGFEDAIAALRWIRDEIAAFGGDPGRVAIGGLSGGGTMVCGPLTAPAAAGLFHAAIVQSSGGCWFPTDPIALAESRGQALASKLGCAGADAAACLRSLPAQAFFRAGGSVDNPFAPGSTEFFTPPRPSAAAPRATWWMATSSRAPGRTRFGSAPSIASR